MSDVKTPTTLKEKSNFLYRLGFLRDQDRLNGALIAARWRLYETVPQKTIRSTKGDKADKAKPSHDGSESKETLPRLGLARVSSNAGKY